MKTSKIFTWTRLMRATVSLMLVFAMLLSGCASLPGDNGNKEENKPEGSVTLGDGKLEAQDAADGVSALYGLLLKILGGDLEMDSTMDMAMQSDIVVTLGDEIKTQLGQTMEQMGLNKDLSWFQSVGFGMTTHMSGDLMQMGVDAKVNGKSIIAATVIMDMLNSMLYASVPELNDQTLGMSMNMGGTVMPDEGTEYPGMGGTAEKDPTAGTGMVGGMGGMLMGGSFAEMFAEHTELIKALPTEEQMNKLITGYLDVVLEYLDDGTTAKETLTQGDVSVNVDATTYVITQHDVLDAAIAVLTKAKTDTELEKALDAFGALANAIAKDQSEDAEQIDLHGELMAEIDDMLEDLQDTKANTEDDEMLRFCTYTANDKTVGIQLTLTAMDVVAKPKDEATVLPMSTTKEDKVSRITVYSLENDGKTAFYLNVADSFELSGTGAVNGQKTSGNYSLKLGGEEYLLIEVKDFTADALNSETLEGTVCLRLGQGLKKTIQTPNLFLNENTMVKLGVKIDAQTMKLDVELYSGEVFLIKLAATNTILELSKITVPENYVDGTNQEAMAGWMGNLNPEGILENLEDAGVPAELIQVLLGMIQGGGFGGEEDVELPNEMYPEYEY